MAGTLDPHYDFALLGTSLPLSILSAALSRAGYSVLHIDENEHYGGPWSSLTLQELLEWSCNTSLHQSQGKHDISIAFPAFRVDDTNKPPPELAALNRHFSISLAPTIVPCAGPTIDVLIRSKVASYCTFRLLQKTSVYSAINKSPNDWPLRKVPSSKEDIFKDKTLSLVDKRRLMKLLQQAVPERDSSIDTSPTVSSPDPSLNGTFFDYLLSKQGANLSPELSTSIAYGVALCSSKHDTTTSAMERIRRHITGIGRYGNAAYLVGQYGGAGEMAQCFCRASAVQGGTFVLGHKVESCSREPPESSQSSNWSISLQGINGATKVEHLVADSDVLGKVIPSELQNEASRPGNTKSVSGILLLDRGIPFETPKLQSNDESTTLPPETGLVIFPPTEKDVIGAVSALQMAEGTFSCPKGMYLVYFSASVKEGHVGKVDAEKELRQARDEIVRMASMSKREWQQEGTVVESELANDLLLPLLECYYTSTEEKKQKMGQGTNIWSAQSCTTNVATSLDEATLQAENLFWEIMGNEKRSNAELARRRRKPMGYSVGQGLGGVVDGMQTESICDFFPREDRGDDDDDEY